MMDKREVWQNRITQAISFKSRGYLEDAIELFEQNIAKGDDDSGSYLTLADYYEKSRRIDDVIRVL